MTYHLDIVLTFEQKETLFKALESISKRHPDSAMAIKSSELKEFIKKHLD